LQIQRELIDERMDILETGAGQELNRELNAQIKKHQEEMRAIAEEMEMARKDKDEEARHELEIETKRMHEEIERFESESRRLASDYQREKNEFQTRLVEMERERQEGIVALNSHGAHLVWEDDALSPHQPRRTALLWPFPNHGTTLGERPVWWRSVFSGFIGYIGCKEQGRDLPPGPILNCW